MMKRGVLMGLFVAGLVPMLAAANGSTPKQVLMIPEIQSGPKRLVTVEDLAALRRIDVVRLAPDKKHFAILVRQADAAANTYRRGWFVGSTAGTPLIPIGDGGEPRVASGLNNRLIGGEYERPSARWSPDGEWLAYTLMRDNEIQLWLSRRDGTEQKQLTRGASDVYEHEWSSDGQSIYFNVGTPRSEIQARGEALERSGYRLDTDLNTLGELMLPRRASAPDAVRSLRVIAVADGVERAATDADRSAFTLAQALSKDGVAERHAAAKTAVAFTARADGAQVWVARADVKSPLMSVFVASGPTDAKVVQCLAAECQGLIAKVWWRDQKAVLFLRYEGAGNETQALYAWVPASGKVSLVARRDEDMPGGCQLTENLRALCTRETSTRTPEIVSFDLQSGAFQTLADVNPEFRRIQLGKVERFKWPAPEFPWNRAGERLAGAYAEYAVGDILYPPDFDPKRKYPVFITPYVIGGIDNMANQEYALHALAAAGFVVLNTQFPQPARDILTRVGPDFGKLMYSAELGFPHLSMLMESTVKALDTVAARGFVDLTRVGIGGVSHGAFVPMFMMQKYDRIAAISVSGGGWDPFEYYATTPAGKKTAVAGYTFLVKPDEEGMKFWKQISLADNVETIEAPMLINSPASETYQLLRLINHMTAAGKPLDVYVFDHETHIKWQPAHLQTIMQRNVDWFRFWLQSFEDPAPAKAEQYSRWRGFKEQRERSAAASGAH